MSMYIEKQFAAIWLNNVSIYVIMTLVLFNSLRLNTGVFLQFENKFSW